VTEVNREKLFFDIPSPRGKNPYAFQSFLFSWQIRNPFIQPFDLDAFEPETIHTSHLHHLLSKGRKKSQRENTLSPLERGRRERAISTDERSQNGFVLHRSFFSSDSRFTL
jgi:hypothetical protein